MAKSKTYIVNDPAALAAKVKAAGGPAIDLAQPSGSASTDGVTLDWTITRMRGAQQGDVVTVSIAKKPDLLPWGLLWAKIDDLF